MVGLKLSELLKVKNNSTSTSRSALSHLPRLGAAGGGDLDLVYPQVPFFADLNLSAEARCLYGLPGSLEVGGPSSRVKPGRGKRKSGKIDFYDQGLLYGSRDQATKALQAALQEGPVKSDGTFRSDSPRGGGRGGPSLEGTQRRTPWCWKRTEEGENKVKVSLQTRKLSLQKE